MRKRYYITVGELINRLKDIDQDTLVVTESSNHEYRPISYAQGITVLFDDKTGRFTEDIYTGDVGEDTEYGKRINVFLII